MYVVLLFAVCLAIYATGCVIAARDKARAMFSDEPMTLTPNERGVFVAQQAQGTHPLTIRARVILAFGLMTLFCVVMAYATGKPDVIGGCTWGLGSGCQYADHSSPNIVWFFLGFWPGAVAMVTAFGSWIFTGRPW